MFDDVELWTDVGYLAKDGILGDGLEVSLYRNEETSPAFLEDHSHIDELIQFISFPNERAQAEWLAQEIQKNIQVDELRHDDIMVINPDPRTTRGNVGLARSLLLGMGINSHIAGFDTDPDTFFRLDVASVTFTGIHRAKGNEAGMVYVINAHDCHSATRNLATIRNRLFTAITRSKSWVRVLGVGDRMDALKKEYERLFQTGFALEFTYPNVEERLKLRIVHRDMSEADRDRLEDRQRSLYQLVEDLRNGEVHVEDLDPTIVGQLRSLLES